ncbi:membrane protein [Arthrobacter phage GlobiWarming]|nr:membrane protein [Arthrobacter phage GlobiWarming]
MLTSILRTVVPYVWGIVVTWLITTVPVLAPLEHQLLGLATLALPILAAVISAAWYAFWRWLEPRLPDWLTRAVLGSAKTPVYPTVTGSQVPNVNTRAPLFQSHDGKHEA